MATLIAHAETAQDIAAGLNRFLDPVPESSTEITALISECFAISSVLRELSTAIGDPRYSWNFHTISEDLEVTLNSLKYVSRVCACRFFFILYKVDVIYIYRAIVAQLMYHMMQLDAYPGMQSLTANKFVVSPLTTFIDCLGVWEEPTISRKGLHFDLSGRILKCTFIKKAAIPFVGGWSTIGDSC